MMSIEFPVQRLAAGLKRRGCTMAAVVGFGVVLSGCAVGPDFVAPAAPPANSYGAPTIATSGVQAGAVPTTPTVSQRVEPGADVPGLWWELFHSEALNRLVESALANNNDVKSAQAALLIAAENAAAQNGAFYPQVSVSMASTRQSTAGTLSSPLASNSYVFNLHTPQLNISYAPDVFGGNRRLVESLEAQVETQRYLVEATRLTLTSNVVMAVIQEASLRDQIKATQDIAGLQRQQLGLLHKQLKAGASTVAEVALQEAVMAQTDASLPVLQKQLSLQRNQLTALLGRLPSDAPTDTFELVMLELPASMPLSLPSQLVVQRPDIRAAQAQMHAASALVGVAMANRLPALTLGGTAGSTAATIGSLLSPGTAFWALTAGLVQPLFDGGALKRRERAAEIAYEQAGVQYRGVVVNAFQNVADALQAIDHDTRGFESAVRFEAAAGKALAAAQLRLKAGDVTLTEVLTAQLLVKQSQVGLVQARANRFVDTTALLQALGGGWWNRVPAEEIQRNPPPAASAARWINSIL